jgi:type II secretory pathway pseudopilin PulG
MVVVIGIMAILLAIVMPVFQNLVGSQGVRSAVRLLCQKLKLARSYAINNREYVALVFPDDSSGLPTEYPYHYYRACIVTESSGSYAFKRWIPGEGWSKLPGNISLVDITNGSATGSFAGATTVATVNCASLNDKSGDDTTFSNLALKGIVFKPTGVAAMNSYLVLADDVMQSGSRVKNNTDDDLYIRVSQYTGSVTFEEK